MNEFDKSNKALNDLNFNLDDILVYQDKRFRAIGTLTNIIKTHYLKDVIIIKDNTPNLTCHLRTTILLNERYIKKYLFKPTQSDLDFKTIEEIN